MGKKSLIAGLVVILAVTANYYYGRKKVLSPILEISTGKLQGIITQSRGGRVIHEYLKIPFARQPVGDLRFAPPQTPNSWEEIYDATEFGPSCIQISLVTSAVEGSEECLYLNVFAPANRKRPLPVMVFFHGGAFIAGTANDYKSAYLLDEDVILLTANYRLGALGFLSTGDDGVIRGNQGLKDQLSVMKWIQRNIKYFGGDPTQVTIFGESAGSYSVGFHLLSPLSKNLFSRAIMQSGSPLPTTLINKNPGKITKDFAAKLNCPTATEGSSKEMIACLRKVDAVTLVSSQKDLLADYPLTDRSKMFLVSIEKASDENAFLPEEPLKILKSGRVNKVPLIIGVNEDEGLLFSSVIASNQTTLNRAKEEWNSIFPAILGYDPARKEITEQIQQFYFRTRENLASPDSMKNYTNLFSDKQFFLPTNKFVKEYAKYTPVRLYQYSYNAEFSLGNILAATQSERLPKVVSVVVDVLRRWIYRKSGHPIPNLGVCHGDELQLLFNTFGGFISKDHSDYRLSKEMVKAWTDFVKGSNSIKIDGVEWPIVNVKGQSATDPLQYLRIDSKTEVVPEQFSDRITFWENLGF